MPSMAHSLFIPGRSPAAIYLPVPFHTPPPPAGKGIHGLQIQQVLSLFLLFQAGFSLKHIRKQGSGASQPVIRHLLQHQEFQTSIAQASHTGVFFPLPRRCPSGAHHQAKDATGPVPSMAQSFFIPGRSLAARIFTCVHFPFSGTIPLHSRRITCHSKLHFMRQIQ